VTKPGFSFFLCLFCLIMYFVMDACLLFRPTFLAQSRLNKAGLKCLLVHPSVRPQKVSSILMKLARGYRSISDARWYAV